jgi:hypothetical protein
MSASRSRSKMGRVRFCLELYESDDRSSIAQKSRFGNDEGPWMIFRLFVVVSGQ